MDIIQYITDNYPENKDRIIDEYNKTSYPNRDDVNDWELRVWCTLTNGLYWFEQFKK